MRSVRAAAAQPNEERHERRRESDTGETLLVWNARVASIRARARGRMRAESAPRGKGAQAPQHDVLSEDERRRLLSDEALERRLAD